MGLPTPEEYEAYMRARQQLVDEDVIRLWQLRIVRENLGSCIKNEHNRALVHCKDLTQLYLRMLRASLLIGVPAGSKASWDSHLPGLPHGPEA